MSARLLLFLFMLLCLSVRSQEYNLTRYNTDNGLPQNSVKDIVKDKYGFIWLTTENGVVRYDGSAFLAFKDFPINNQRFTFFYGDVQKDSILTGAGYHTILLNRRTAKVFKDLHHSGVRYTYSRNHVLSHVNYNYHPKQGGPFHLTMKEGHYFITDSSVTYVHPSSLKEVSLSLNTVFKNRSTLFTLNEKLYHIDYASGKVYRITNGRITAGYDMPFLTNNNSVILWSQITNSVFIIKDQKIYSLSYEKNYFRITLLADLGNLHIQHLTCAYYDKMYNKLYLGSSIEGLTVLNFHQFFSTKENSATNTVFYSTLPYDNTSVITPLGQIYSRRGLLGDKAFDTDSQYFISYDQNKNIIVQDSGKVYAYLSSSSFSTRNLIIQTPNTLVDFLYDQNRYYAVTRPSLRQYSGGNLLVYKDRSFKMPERIIPLDSEPTKLFRANGFLWVGTIHELIKISLKTYKKNNIATGKDFYVRNIIRSNDGNLWITTLGKGFYFLKTIRLSGCLWILIKIYFLPIQYWKIRNNFFGFPPITGCTKYGNENFWNLLMTKTKK